MNRQYVVFVPTIQLMMNELAKVGFMGQHYKVKK